MGYCCYLQCTLVVRTCKYLLTQKIKTIRNHTTFICYTGRTSRDRVGSMSRFIPVLFTHRQCGVYQDPPTNPLDDSSRRDVLEGVFRTKNNYIYCKNFANELMPNSHNSEFSRYWVLQKSLKMMRNRKQRELQIVEVFRYQNSTADLISFIKCYYKYLTHFSFSYGQTNVSF